MSARYTAAWASEDRKQRRGVLVDGRLDRHAFFPNLKRAQEAADRLSDDDEPPFFWRRNSDGELVSS